MKAPRKVVTGVSASCLALSVVVHSQQALQQTPSQKQTQAPVEAPAGFDSRAPSATRIQ